MRVDGHLLIAARVGCGNEQEFGAVDPELVQVVVGQDMALGKAETHNPLMADDYRRFQYHAG